MYITGLLYGQRYAIWNSDIYLNTTDDLFPLGANHLPVRRKQRHRKQAKNHTVLIIKAQRSDYVLSTYYISGTFNVLL